MITQIRKKTTGNRRQRLIDNQNSMRDVANYSAHPNQVFNGETVGNSLICANFLAQILIMEEIDSSMFKFIDSELKREHRYEAQANAVDCDDVLILEMNSTEPPVPIVHTRGVVTSVTWGEPDVTEIDEIDAMLFDE